jgi:hypothetical protein
VAFLACGPAPGLRLLFFKKENLARCLFSKKNQFYSTHIRVHMFNVTNPATEEIVATLLCDTQASVHAKCMACRAEHARWRVIPLADRQVRL